MSATSQPSPSSSKAPLNPEPIRVSIEWLIAAIPLYLWLVAYVTEHGYVFAAAVPNSMVEISVSSMLNAAAIATIMVFGPLVGTCHWAQEVYEKSPKTTLAFLILVIAFGALVTAYLSGSGRRLIGASVFVAGSSSILIGLYVKRAAFFGEFLADSWRRSWTNRFASVYLLATIMCLAAASFGYAKRLLLDNYTVLKSECGPAAELFQRNSDTVLLINHSLMPSIELRSVSGAGPLRVVSLSVEEVEFRRMAVGPCPSWAAR